MKMVIGMIMLSLSSTFAVPAYSAECPAILNYSMAPLRGGDPLNFCNAYGGKVILAVNTASQCGFTPQFKGLEALYQKYKDKGLVVLGFPSNDFYQEFATAEETAKMCYINYGVTFPMFAKSAVKGKDANEFFKKLAEESGVAPKWNFYKYLIGANGKVLGSYSPMTGPDSKELELKIESALAEASQQKK